MNMESNEGFESVKKIGIAAHSYEGGSLCFITACREGAEILGPHMHPNVLLSAIPMGLSMPAWEADDFVAVRQHLAEGVKQVVKSGADFFICPDNTAHIVLEEIIDTLPIPGLHIADVVCQEIVSNGWTKVGLLGTKWTMTGTVYGDALEKKGLERIIPPESVRSDINTAIFEELCQGIFKPETVQLFLDAIEGLKQEGAECVILGCTEIPLIVTPENSPLPTLDSTRLLAKYAVKLAVFDVSLAERGWVEPNS